MKKFLLIILALIISLSCAVCIFIAGLFAGHRTVYDVSYGAKNCEKMDIYLPKRKIKSSEQGCVLFIHGGSWTGGDKAEEKLKCAYLANKGYICASMNYTLYSEESADKFSLDIIMDEIDAALIALCDFASERGITVTKAATAGYSAGAHLSLLYAYSRADSAPLEIVFASGMGGPADFDTEIWGDVSLTIAHRLAGVTLTKEELSSDYAREVLASVSPVTFITQNSPPSLFMYGGKDEIVSHKNGESLKRRLEQRGIEYKYVFQKNAGHGLIANPITRFSYNRALVDFCDKYF